MSEGSSNMVTRLVDRVFPRSQDFFSLVNEQCDLVVASSEAFVEFMRNGDPEYALRVRELEHMGDELKARNIDILNRAFSTPMDREDLYRAMVGVDQVANYAKTTVREMELLAVKPDSYTLEMSVLLRDGAEALQQGFAMLATDPAAAEPHAQAARAKGFHQLRDDIPAQRRIHHAEWNLHPLDIADAGLLARRLAAKRAHFRLGVEHAEALAVLRGEHEVFEAPLLGVFGPLCSIETGRVECGRDRPVFLHGDLEPQHDPLRYIPLFDSMSFPFPSEYGIGSPMNKHSKLAVLEPGGNILRLIPALYLFLRAWRA